MRAWRNLVKEILCEIKRKETGTKVVLFTLQRLSSQKGITVQNYSTSYDHFDCSSKSRNIGQFKGAKQHQRKMGVIWNFSLLMTWN